MAEPVEPESPKSHPDAVLNARHMHGHDNSVFSSVDETLPSNGRPAQLPQHLQMSSNGYDKSSSSQHQPPARQNGAESSRL